MIHLECDSCEDLSEGSYFDDDFYVSVKENYTQDKEDWQSQDIVYISSYSNKNGTLKVYVDDNEKQNYALTNGYFACESNEYGSYNRYFQYIYPEDIGIVDFGKYNISVKFNSDTLIDTGVNVNEKDDFDIWMQNPYYCEQDYWSSPSFIIIDSNHLNTGNLDVYVNNTKKLSYTLSNGNFTEIADCSNKSRYIAPSDLFDTYGSYFIQINFTENSKTITLKEDNVLIAEFEPTVNPKLELYFDFYTLYLRSDNIAHIYLPREATGNLTISYNNVQNEAVSYSRGHADYHIYDWDLNHLGENIITVKYCGDDFGTLTANASVIVVPGITAPYFAGVGEEFTISMITHDWVYGTFNVYQSADGNKGKLITSGAIAGGISSVKLSENTVGLNKYILEFAYPGGYYDLIQEVYIVENSPNITVDISQSVEVGQNVTVNITAPASEFSFAYISLDGEDAQFYSMANGEVIKVFSGLNKGYHTISIQYNNGYYEDGKLTGDVYSKTFKVLVGNACEISSSDVEVNYGDSASLTVTLKDTKGNVLADKKVTITFNANIYSKTTDSNGQVILPLNLNAGTYTADIKFDGDEDYISAENSSKITVNKISSALTAPQISYIYNVAKNLDITLKDANGRVLADKLIRVTLNGAVYTGYTDNNGQVKIKVSLPAKTYTALISFEDDNYLTSQITTKISVLKASVKLIAKSRTFKVKSTKKVTATLKNNLGKVMKKTKIYLKVNKKTYTAKTNSKGIATFKIKISKKGTYKAVYKYKGSSNYKSITKYMKIKIR